MPKKNSKMETQEQTYIKGFNDGYKLARYQPEILGKIKDSLNESIEYERGLIAGVKEWEEEKEKGKMEELEQLRNQSQGKDKGNELSH